MLKPGEASEAIPITPKGNGADRLRLHSASVHTAALSAEAGSILPLSKVIYILYLYMNYTYISFIYKYIYLNYTYI